MVSGAYAKHLRPVKS